jgi:hypothetical protein
MQSSKILAGVAVAFLNVALCAVGVGQDHATAQEVIAKVREAASALSMTGDLAQFNRADLVHGFEGQKVKITGVLDPKIRQIHVLKIELEK